MTLKSSFLANLKENNKRRIWLWLVSILGFVIMFPSLVAMSLSRTAASLENYVGGNMSLPEAREFIHQMMLDDMRYMLGVSEFAYFSIGVLAIISAMQGFSYLYSRQKIDFYMGMPMKRKTRFFIIWLNGILIYLLPYLLGLVISGIIAAANSAMNGDVLREMALAYGMHLCYFLGMYHLGILAVMLTGNVIITFCGIMVFLFYEVVARLVIRGYMDLFFQFFSEYNYSVAPIFSPFAILNKYARGRSGGDVGNTLLTAVILLLFALVVGVVSYFLYLKRPGEAAGKAMVFSWSCPWIKLLISVLVSMLAGIAVCDIVEYSPKYYGDRHIGFVIFTMVLALLISGCLMQIIYEFDIRGILHKKRQLLISAVLTAFIFCIFRFDLLGYDSYLPDAEQIESAVLVTGGTYSYYRSDYFDEKFRVCSRTVYMQENMNLTDTGAVNKLMKLCIDASKEAGGINAMFMDDSGEWYAAEVTFRLKSNREVHRSIYVNVKNPETVELLDRIESSEEYLGGSDMAFSPVIDQVLADDNYGVISYYDNGAYTKSISRKEATELLELYRKDMRTSDFSSLSASMPVGRVLLYITKEFSGAHRGGTTQYVQLNIYPFFDSCIQYLKEKDCYMDGYFVPEDVEFIQVTNYHYGDEAKGGMESSTASLPSYVTYEGDAILQLADHLYPVQMTNSYWYTTKREDGNYSVTVFFKPDSMAARSANAVNYVFLAGEVPDFVVKDTAAN